MKPETIGELQARLAQTQSTCNAVAIDIQACRRALACWITRDDEVVSREARMRAVESLDRALRRLDYELRSRD